MQITQVELWNDVGFTEGAMEVPSGSYPKTASTTINAKSDPYRVPAKDLFSKIRLRANFSSVYKMQYIAITYLDDATSTQGWMPGWIDRVDLLTDTGDDDNSLIEIHWHPDLWRAYYNKATFGSGLVTRRRAGFSNKSLGITMDPPQQEYDHIRENPKYIADLFGSHVPSGSGITHVVVMNINSALGSGLTTIETIAYPVSASSPSKQYQIMAYTGTSGVYQTIKVPSLTMTLLGLADEVLNLDPAAVISMFITPVPPGEITLHSYGGYVMDGWGWADAGNTGDEDDKPYWSAGVDSFAEYSRNISDITSETVMTTDTVTWAVTDMDTQVVHKLPWGVQPVKVMYRVINAISTMYVGIRFDPVSTNSGKNAAAYGLEINIPLKSLPLGSNSYSSYVYSGQQDYDRQAMAYQRQLQFNTGYASAIASGLEGGVAGGIMGGMEGGIGTAAGAAVGAGTSAMGGFISTGVQYHYQGQYNAQMLTAKKVLAKAATPALLLPGSSTDWINCGRDVALITLTWDPYSQQVRANDIATYGVHVSEAYGDDDMWVLIADAANNSGPIQIKNLNVTGPIPPAARRYIAQRFADGVIFRSE